MSTWAYCSAAAASRVPCRDPAEAHRASLWSASVAAASRLRERPRRTTARRSRARTRGGPWRCGERSLGPARTRPAGPARAASPGPARARARRAVATRDAYGSDLRQEAQGSLGEPKVRPWSPQQRSSPPGSSHDAALPGTAIATSTEDGTTVNTEFQQFLFVFRPQNRHSAAAMLSTVTADSPAITEPMPGRYVSIAIPFARTSRLRAVASSSPPCS
jgi:hypothetical protein